MDTSLLHFHLTFSGLVCLLSLWEAAGALSFHDPFEGTEIAKAQPLAERGRGHWAKKHIFKNWVHPVLLSAACGEQTCSPMIPHTPATRPPECTGGQSRLLVSSVTEERARAVRAKREEGSPIHNQRPWCITPLSSRSFLFVPQPAMPLRLRITHLSSRD